MSSTEALVSDEVPSSYGSVPDMEEQDESPLLHNNPPSSSIAPTEIQNSYPSYDPPPYEEVASMIHSSRAGNNTDDDGYNIGRPVVITQPSLFFPSKTNYYIGPRLPAVPEPITCRSCKESVVTKVEARVSMRTHLCAILCCVMGGCCCLGWVPYCINKCKTKYHYCPKCDAYVGVGIESPFVR